MPSPESWLIEGEAIVARENGRPRALAPAGEQVVGWIGQPERDGTCRVCGCTDERACPGGCWWAADGLCSSCWTGGSR